MAQQQQLARSLSEQRWPTNRSEELLLSSTLGITGTERGPLLRTLGLDGPNSHLNVLGNQQTVPYQTTGAFNYLSETTHPSQLRALDEARRKAIAEAKKAEAEALAR